MSNVYIVKSGMLKDFVGWEWVNLKAFIDYNKAKEFQISVEKQIEPEDLGIKEDVYIDALTLEV
jgi:hypothetical protein